MTFAQVQATAKQVEAETGVKFRPSGKYVNGQFWGTSMYAVLRERKIRISDHGMTSEKYKAPAYNHVAGVDSVKDLVNYIKDLQATAPIKREYEMSYVVPAFNSEAEIKEGVYNLIGRNNSDITAEVINVKDDCADVIWTDLNGTRSMKIKKQFIMNWETKVSETKTEVIY